MLKPSNRYLLLIALTTLVVLLLDLVSKQVVLSSLGIGETVSVIGDFLRLTLVYNEGGAFSTRLGSSLFYAIVSSIVIILVGVYLYREAGRRPLLEFSLAVVIGGALGNLIDRFRFGSVIDWVDVDFFDIHLPAGKFLFIEHSGYGLTRWPVFNVADAAITVGVVSILVYLIFRRKRVADADPACVS